MLRKNFKESGSSYLLMFLAGLGILFLSYGLLIVASFHSMFPTGDRKMIFVIGLLLGGTLFSSSHYSFFKSEAKTIQFLLLPATAGEKLLVGFVLTQIMYLITYLGIFTGIDWLMCLTYNEFVAIPNWIIEQEKHYYQGKPIFQSDTILIKELVILYFITTSIAHLGSISFIRNAYVKTAILFVISFIGIIYLNNKMLVMLIPEEIMPHGKYFTDSFRIGPLQQPTGIVTLPESWQLRITWFLPIFLYSSCWIMSYYKLKEKQI
ncbi:hypothetical protein [Sediminibacterium sp.]|uniref:hypothetical protein n=1 Tax=Sediminibacterium sp. TaxID=1917865 RepID=UPI003F6A0FA5